MNTPEWERSDSPIEVTDSGELKVCAAVGAVIDNPQILAYFCNRTGEQCEQLMMEKRGKPRTPAQRDEFAEGLSSW